MISIIVRTLNEGRWLRLCLDAVFKQQEKDFEVIVVDSGSTDNTLAIAKEFGVRIVILQPYSYTPGKAINEGIRESQGKLIVCLNAHCVPATDYWLEHLTNDIIVDTTIGGVYGRQLAMSFSSSRVKHEMLTVFGLDRKIQSKDSFFHNANSAFRREVWEKYPFDENAKNIEDRLWAQRLIDEGYKLLYEPNAGAYHHHGISHEGNAKRDANVARMLVDLEPQDQGNEFNIEHLSVVGILPVKGELVSCGDHPLIDYTIEAAQRSSALKEIFVIPDNADVADHAKQSGVTVPFIRPDWLSDELIDLQEVIQYSLKMLEEQEYLFDMCVILEQTFPFRHPGLIDALVKEFLVAKQECLIPAKVVDSACWIERKNELVEIYPMMPRKMRDNKLLQSLFGLGAVMSPRYILEGRFGEDFCVLKVDANYAGIELRDEETLAIGKDNLEKFWAENYH